MATTTFTKKSLGSEAKEPAVTPPPAGGATNFAKKSKLGSGKSKKRDIPEGLWTKCPKCEAMVFDKELDENPEVCPKCEFHFPISARERIHSLGETCTFEEMDADMTSVDPLEFVDKTPYPEGASKSIKTIRFERRRPDGYLAKLADIAPLWA